MGKSSQAERNLVSFNSATWDAAFHEKIVAKWQAEQDRCLRDIDRHQGAHRSYLEEGVRFIELVQNARRLFEKQNSRDKRYLPNFLVSNCSSIDGELSVTLKQLFDLMAETAMIDAQKKAAGEVSNRLFL
mgnify:CR=1 FL=1